MYHKDLDYADLLSECEHLKHYMVLHEDCVTLPALYRKIISDNLKSVFPNVEIALKSIHVQDSDQLCWRTFIFKTETYLKKTASNRNEAAAFQLAFTHVYGK